MAKRVLGRGLDTLMRGQTLTRQESGAIPAVDTPSVAPEPVPSETKLGRGFTSLLNAAKQHGASEETLAAVAAQKSQAQIKVRTWPIIGWLIVDCLLLCSAAWVVSTARSGLDWKEIVFAGLAVSLGAAAAIVAVYKSMAPAHALSNAKFEWVTFSSEKSGGTRKYLVHCQDPLFVGEVVDVPGRGPEVVPLWIAPDGVKPNQAVEQLLTNLRRVPEAGPKPNRPAADLRRVLVRI